MPIYEFRCDSCKNCFEKLSKNIEYNLHAECPNCHSEAVRMPSLCAMITESPRLQTESSNPVQNRKRPFAAVDMSNTINSSIKDCTFQGVDRAIYYENATNFRGENLTFDNVRIGIEHKNSDMELKNLKYEKF